MQSKPMSAQAHNAFASWGIKEEHLPRIDSLKEQAAHLWDCLHDIPVPPGNTLAHRMVALAKTNLEEAVMWAVKAYSRYEDGQPKVGEKGEVYKPA